LGSYKIVGVGKAVSFNICPDFFDKLIVYGLKKGVMVFPQVLITIVMEELGVNLFFIKTVYQ
jgi:hypothetical protein